jgi:hypothetical protein
MGGISYNVWLLKKDTKEERNKNRSVASKQAWIDYKTPRTSHNLYRIHRLW